MSYWLFLTWVVYLFRIYFAIKCFVLLSYIVGKFQDNYCLDTVKEYYFVIPIKRKTMDTPFFLYCLQVKDKFQDFHTFHKPQLLSCILASACRCQVDQVKSWFSHSLSFFLNLPTYGICFYGLFFGETICIYLLSIRPLVYICLQKELVFLNIFLLMVHISSVMNVL